MAIKLDNVKKGLLFKMLGSKSLYETGVAYGFDKHYKDARAVNNAVYRIYQAVQKEPEKYMVTPEVVELVVANVSNRNMTKKEGTLKEKNDAIDKQDVKEIILSGRKKASELLHMKLDRIGSSKKRLDEVNISSLATVFGILFDKAQIISGEATENVAILAKIDSNLPPEEAIDMVLKMREMNNIEKEKKQKK